MGYCSISLNYPQFHLSVIYSSQHMSFISLWSGLFLRFSFLFFFLLDVILKGMVFLVSLSDISLLV